MRKFLMASAAVTAIVAAQLPATDAAADGLYLSGFGGVGWAQDVKGDYNYFNVVPYGVEFDTDTGFVLGLAGGYKFDFGGRAELEFGYRSNELASVDYSPGGPSNISGDINVYSLMANAWYDIDTGTGFMPYLGGGIGMAWLTSDNWQFSGGPNHSNNSDTAFAYQLGAGVNYAFNETLALGLGYRFFGTTSFELENTYPTATNYQLDGYYNHSVLLSLTVSFGGID